LFCAYTALLKQIQATYQNQAFADEETGEARTEHSILQDVIQAEVLLLDDLGAVRSTEWSLSTLYHLINERYNHRRTTLITTNVPWEVSSSKPPEKQSEDSIQAREVMRVEALRDRISERTYSRIAEMCPHRIELDGVDYRRIRGAR
jgi:DNA replication protein DnaC